MTLLRNLTGRRNVYTLSLENEAPARRLQVWRDLMQERVMDVGRDIEADAIRGAIVGQAFDGGALGHWTLSRQSVQRTQKMTKALDDEYVFVSVMLDGKGGIEQDGKRTDLDAGDFVVIDGTRPFSATTISNLNTRGFFHLRKSAFRRRLGTREDLALGVYKAGQPLQGLTSSFLRDLVSLIGRVDHGTMTALVEQSLDMIVLLANERRPGAIDPSTHQAAMLARLKVHMQANLKDAAYSVEMAAASLGITARYVHVLMSLEGTSFGRRLLDARLEAARRDIINPRHVHRQIIEIAFDWGFNNASHFGRVFKERFGMTPREAKMAGVFSAVGAS